MPGIYGSVQQLDRNRGNGALLLFVVIFQIFRATVMLVGLADEKLMNDTTKEYAAMMLANIYLSCVRSLIL